MHRSKFFNSIKQRGQMMVFFALMIPIMLLLVGLALDLGWYYLNVSRLQNAADAAAVAGAKKLVDEKENLAMHRHFYVGQGSVVFLITPPSDLVEFNEIYYTDSLNNTSTTASVDHSGNMNANFGANGGTKHETINLAVGEDAAKEYAIKNLGSAQDIKVKNKIENWIIDKWNTSTDIKDQKVTLQTKLYATAMDVKETTQNNKAIRDMRYYYEVKLSEDIPHFFLSGWFKPMKTVVSAYAMLKPHDRDLFTSITLLEQINVIANWEYQDKYHNYTGKWNHYRYSRNNSPDRSAKIISYKVGDDFRTENVNVQQTGGSGIPTSANHNNYYSEDEVDSINIDFNQDVEFSGQFTDDWDLNSELPKGATIKKYVSKDGWSEDVGYDLRIQGLINLNYAWKNRKLEKIKSGNYTSADLLPDILWTRIESDPIWSKMPWKTQLDLNSVRQMIINVNEPNTDVYTFTDSNGNEQKVYEKRPFFIFYMGPETNTESSDEYVTFAEDTRIRKSQPVILNLNADFNGILYAPNSPVVINGNGNTMRGFVVAKEFLRLKEDEDFTNDGYIAADDEYGHTIFVKQSDTLSESDFSSACAGYTVTPDSENGIYSLYETPTPATRYLVLRITKQDFDTVTHSIKNDFLSTTYKEDLKIFRNVTDEELSTISFPDEGNNNTLEEYPVVTADLTDAKDGENSVKVLLHNNDGTTTEKYIYKKNLPYVKVRQNELRPYACVYDIKKRKHQSGDFSKGYNGVTIQDYILAEGNTGKNTYSDVDTVPDVSPYDYRSMQSDSLSYYTNNYVDKKLTFVELGSCKYFMLTSEIPKNDKVLVCQYRKITHEGTTEYVKEKDAKYYMKLVPNGSSENNPIIVDNYGNIQVHEKPLSDSYWGVTRPTNSNEQPDDLDKYKTLQDSTSGQMKDYRDMSLEVVYKMQEAFNIKEYSDSGDLISGYSYFQISNLKRKNYKYLNVDELNKTPADKWHVVDMFFTAKRASWVD